MITSLLIVIVAGNCYMLYLLHRLNQKIDATAKRLAALDSDLRG